MTGALSALNRYDAEIALLVDEAERSAAASTSPGQRGVYEAIGKVLTAGRTLPVGSGPDVIVDPDDGPVAFDGVPVEDVEPALVEAVRDGLAPTPFSLREARAL